MIYVTGDIHGDLTRFKSSNVHKLKKSDIIVVCGDFGFIWDDSKSEKDNINWLSKRKYEILFVEGAHENFELLNRYPVVERYGGNVRKIAENIYQLIRGEIYNIENKYIFAFGGGDDEEMEFDDITECDEFTRLPTEEECERARNNLKKYQNNVDYVITYDIGFKFRSMLKMESNCFNNLHAFLNEVATECRFKKWYFGCFHIDKAFTSAYYGAYKNIYELESGRELK